MRYGLTTGIVISSVIFALSVCLFCFGCNFVFIGTDSVIWMWIVIATGIISIISVVAITKCKFELNRYIEYGKPVYLAAGHIKEIINKVNVYGINSLQEIIEKAMKDELMKVVKKERK